MKNLFLIATLFFCTLGAQAETFEIAGAGWESSWEQTVSRARLTSLHSCLVYVGYTGDGCGHSTG